MNKTNVFVLDSFGVEHVLADVQAVTNEHDWVIITRDGREDMFFRPVYVKAVVEEA